MSRANSQTLHKFNIRSEILVCLYKTTELRLFNQLKNIAVKNAVRIGAGHASFMYKAQNYSCDANPILPRPRNQLHNDYVSIFQEYLFELKQFNEEYPIVEACLTRVLNLSSHSEDWLKLLPHSLHAPIKNYPLVSSSPKTDQERIDLFLLDNKDFTRLIKRRLATNLIVI